MNMFTFIKQFRVQEPIRKTHGRGNSLFHVVHASGVAKGGRGRGGPPLAALLWGGTMGNAAVGYKPAKDVLK